MLQFEKYDIKEKLYATESRILLRAERKTDKASVIIKHFSIDTASLSEFSRVKHEFDLIEKINSDCVIKVYDLEVIESGVAIIIEDFKGNDLGHFLEQGHEFSIDEFLHVAICITKGLQEIHEKKIIHLDIKPGNVIYNPENQQVKIVDFGISKTFDASVTDQFSGSYPYISPEQTGRMNRSIDLRSDLYSLGATFYHLITGKPPFESSDPLEIIHAHIAKTPTEACEVNADIPLALSNILSKLLVKEADYRYQTANGVLHDLEVCFEHWQDSRSIPDDFPVGAADSKQVFHIPQKIYGREQEIVELLNAFDRTANGCFDLVAIGGYSGIGKSCLINEIQKPLVEKRGIFSSGKYDQFNKSKPYSAIIQLFTGVVRSILTSPEDEINYWKAAISQKLGDDSQCLIDIMPQLAHLLGEQAPAAELSVAQAKTHLTEKFGELAQVMASPSHPFILFLDDLQWADSASLSLILHWINQKIPYLLMIMAYRNNEVDPLHPFSIMLEHAKEVDPMITEMALSPLDEQAVTSLVRDTLIKEPDEVAELVSVLMQKTDGNPFFINQLLTGFYQDQLIIYQDSGWQWKIDEIKNANVSDDVIELMAKKLKKYPEETQSSMNMCAILGSEFKLSMLAMGLGISLDDAYQTLLSPVADGLIKESGNRLKFSHDKIQETSYALVAEQERLQRHYLIGTYLLDNLSSTAIDAQLFKIVEDLNKSKSLINCSDEKLNLAKLNYRAGIKAKDSSAFDAAVGYFRNAKKILSDKIWSIDSDFAFQLHMELAASERANADLDEALKNIKLCLKKEPDLIKTAPVVQLYLDVLFILNQHHEAMTFAIKHLQTMGLHLSSDPSKLLIINNYLKFKLKQGFRSTESLSELNPISDQKSLAILKILSQMAPSAYMVNSNLLGLISMKMALLTLDKGNSIFACFAYAMMGFVEQGVLKLIQSGKRYYDLSLAVQEKYPDPEAKGRVEMLYSTFCYHWIDPIDGWEKSAKASMTYNEEIGVIHWADYSQVLTRCQSLFLGRKPLTVIYQKNGDVLAFHKKHTDETVVANQTYILNFIKELSQQEELKHDLDEDVDSFDLQAYHEEMSRPGNITFRAYHTITKQINEYLKGNYKKSMLRGLSFCIKAIDVFGSMQDFFHRYAFILAFLATPKKELGIWEYFKASTYYRINRYFFWVYGKNSRNFDTHIALIRAEEYRRKNKTTEALNYYEKSILAGKRVSLFNEALAVERLANYYKQLNNSTMAEMSAYRAYALYKKWGCESQCEYLVKHYPTLDSVIANEQKFSTTITKTATASASESLDMMSLARGSQAISGEIKIEKLIESLLQQLVQTSGAEKAVLLLKENGKLLIQGQLCISGDETTQLHVLQNVAFPAPEISDAIVAQTVVQYVSRSNQLEVLDDGQSSRAFSQDPYIKANQVKSILCMPIINQGSLVGILYLENNLLTHAFTEQHCTVLEILASQAAISIDNSNLYRNLEHKVEQRTVALNEKTNDINNMLQNLHQGIFTIIANKTIHPEYSSHLETILGTRRIAKENFISVIFDNSNISENDLNQVDAVIFASIGEDEFNFTANKALLVTEIKKELPNGDIKILELDWDPICTEDDQIDKIMVTVRDVTALRALQEVADTQKRELEIIGEILALSNEKFVDFIETSNTYFQENKRIIDTTQDRDIDVIATLFRNMHTVKGNARTYGLTYITNSAHLAERTYDELRKDENKEWDCKCMLRELDVLQQTLDEYDTVYKNKLAAFIGEEAHSTPVDNHILEGIRLACQNSDIHTASQLVDAIDTKSLEDILQGLQACLPEMAQKLQKATPSFTIISQGIRFKKTIVQLLCDVFMHMVRNSIDHGLEKPDERLERGKPEAGQLHLIVDLDSSHVNLRFFDDGRGLAMARLKQKAEDNNLNTEDKQSIANLIFASGMSTAEKVSDISGRGVGMDAVKQFVQQSGGDVNIDLKESNDDNYQPFEIHVSLPSSCAVSTADSISTVAPSTQSPAHHAGDNQSSVNH